MRITIKTLRTGIVVVAGLLVCALLLFFVYARYQMHRLAKDLPGKLGVQIQQSAEGYSITRSDAKGRPVFTLHASRLVQFKNGHAQLHDVGITLYGPNGDRADRISGSEFDYDDATGVATASGEVQIDLSSPATAAPPTAAGKASVAPADANAQRNIHVKTSGLVYNRKTGVATTDAAAEFQLPKAAGKAIGATYDSQLGMLVLKKDVEINSSENGSPLLVRASHAQLLRESRQVFLLNASAEYEQEQSSSNEAIVYFRPDGSAERIDARGNFHLHTQSGQDVKAQNAGIALDGRSQPRHADVGGGILFVSDDQVHHMHGDAVEGSFQFADGVSLRHVQLRKAVSFVDQQLALPNDPRGSSTREVRASQLDVDFAPGPDQHAQAQKALAVGNAGVVLHTISTTGPQQSTAIAADQLLVTLANGNTITALTGTGHTSISNAAPDGVSQTSTGDSLNVTFADVSAQSAVKNAKKNSPDILESPSSRLQSAIQQGNVTMTQTSASEPGKAAPPPVHAYAQRADYRTADQTVHLSGNPRFNDGSLDLTAQAIDFHRDSGDASASGGVKATYTQTSSASASPAVPNIGGQGPAHVIASEAIMNRSTGEAVFRGQARLWQGTNAVSAPEISLSRARQTLTAHGGTGNAAVNAVFAVSPDAKHQQTVVRIHSSDLVYSEAERLARFRGSVIAEEPTGTIRSDQADVFLVPSSAPSQNTGQSQIDHLVGSGHVMLLQPGRKGTGEKLVYTQGDGHCLLTGTASAPPRLSDQTHGTITGASLIFNTRDDSVSVNGGSSSAITETRVPK